jgi:hypothetical protein
MVVPYSQEVTSPRCSLKKGDALLATKKHTLLERERERERKRRVRDRKEREREREKKRTELD